MLDDGEIDGFDIALFSGGRDPLARVGATVRRGRRHRDRQLLGVPARPRDPAGRRPRSTRTRSSAHRGLIANPNCSTMQLMVAVAPIHRAVGIERMIVATYQSVSGTGMAAVDELEAQAHASLHGVQAPPPQIYPEPIAFNVIGAAGNFAEGDDHTDEERKMMFETRKILEDESIGVAVTCVRVPVRTGHSEAVNLQTREPLSAEDAAELLRGSPGLVLENVPTPLRAAGRDEVFVGRIRRDHSHPRALGMFVVGDNLRKGAATNAVQIAELLVRNREAAGVG